MSIRTLRLMTAGAAAAIIAVPSAAAAQTSIRIGQSVSGSLSSSDLRLNDKSYMDEYVFSGSAGQRLRISMRSGAFDAYLIFGTGTGTSFEQIDFDDDGGDELDSMLEVTLSSSGQFTIRANSAEPSEFGAYTLSLESLGGGSSGSVKGGGGSAPQAPANGRAITVCVVDEGALQEVRALYNPATGDTTVNGRRFSDVYGGGRYAAGASWYINGERITVNGRRYVKYGLPRVLGTTEVTRLAEFNGVTAFAEAGSGKNPEVIYMPVRYGCEFQPYQVDE